MFLTAHVMIGFIIYKLLNLDANLLLFLFCCILPDASWPFFRNHRQDSFYHTVLFFSVSIFFPPYYLAIVSHFIADFFTGGIRLTPWSKKTIGIISQCKKEKIQSKNQFFLTRLVKHVFYIFKKKKYMIIIELFLFLTCLFLIFD